MSVIVTGASGFVGHHIVGELLSTNHKVIAIVRTKESQDKLLRLFSPSSSSLSSNLSFEIVSELDKPHAFDSIFDHHPEATTFINVASIVKFEADDYAKEILDPTINIIKYTLQSIIEHGQHIKRVILTSSLASIAAPDKAFSYDKEYGETDWSPLTYELGKINGTMAYFTAKKLAEEEAWKITKEQGKGKFELVAILPSLILGPARFNSEVTKDNQPSTAGMIGGLLKLKKDDAIPPLVAGAVDVRDVAKVHVLAVDEEKFAGKRVLLESNKITNDNMIKIIIDNFPDLKEQLPTPNPIDEKQFVKPKDEKSKKLIGFKLRPLDDSVIDLIKQVEGLLIENAMKNVKLN